MLRIALAGIGLVTLFGAPIAIAQERTPEDEALEAFETGRVAYDEGRFEDALGRFRRAYELTPSPAVLYNIATILDRLRRDEDALAAYEEYLARFAQAEERPNVEARVRILREAIARHTTAPPVEEADPDPDPDPDTDTATGRDTDPDTDPDPDPDPDTATGPGLAPWLVFGGGVLVAAVGGVMIGLWAADSSTVTSYRGTAWADIDDAHGRAGAFGVTGTILLTVGGAALVGGLVWALVGGGSDDRDEPVAVGLGIGSLVVEGRF